jgi:hypothetical protein
LPSALTTGVFSPGHHFQVIGVPLGREAVKAEETDEKATTAA